MARVAAAAACAGVSRAAEAGGVKVDTVINTAVALVTTAILTGTWAIARKMYKVLYQRDALLAEVQQTLVELSDLRHGMLMQKAYEL